MRLFFLFLKIEFYGSQRGEALQGSNGGSAQPGPFCAEGQPGSAIGSFRNAPENADAPTVISVGTVDSPVTIAEALQALPLAGYLNGHLALLNGFGEDLEAKAFLYAGKKYPIVQLADGRWWMAAPLADWQLS